MKLKSKSCESGCATYVGSATWKGNETPCDMGCGYVFQQDKKYDLLVEREGVKMLIFVCADCYKKARGILRGTQKF